LLVGCTISGRVLLHGDANRIIRVLDGSELVVQLRDTSLADARAIIIKDTKISNLVNFPFNYEIEIPENLSSSRTYTLIARISKGDTLLYINDQSIPADMEGDSSLTIDIPVIPVGNGLYFFK
jgi:uncharacterized lipoprotein YbaY